MPPSSGESRTKILARAPGLGLGLRVGKYYYKALTRPSHDSSEIVVSLKASCYLERWDVGCASTCHSQGCPKPCISLSETKYLALGRPWD